EAGVPKNQLRRIPALAEQVLRSVQVSQDRLQQTSSLHQPCLEGAGFLRADEQGNWIELPGPMTAAGIAVDAIGDAVFTDQLFRLFPAARQLVHADGTELLQESTPLDLHGAVGADHLVWSAGKQLVAKIGFAFGQGVEIGKGWLHASGLFSSNGAARRAG